MHLCKRRQSSSGTTCSSWELYLNEDLIFIVKDILYIHIKKYIKIREKTHFKVSGQETWNILEDVFF